MEEEKYIIYEDNSFDIFPVWEKHSEIAKTSDKKPVAAGFLRKMDGEKWCGGHSHSLGLTSRGEEDFKIIFATK